MKNFNTIAYLHFSKILFMEHNAKNICKTVISGKEQNLNKQIAEFEISILFQHFLYIFAKFQYFFEVLENNSVLFQYLQYRVGTLIKMASKHS